MSSTGRGTLPGVWDEWGCPSEDPRWVERSTKRSRTGQVTLSKIRHRWEGPPDGLGSGVRRHSLEVRDGSGDDTKGLGRVWEPSRKYGTGWGTLLVFRNTLGTLPEVRDESGDPPGGPGRVGGPN